VRADSGELVPLGGIVSFEDTIEPSSRTQHNQLNSLTLEGVLAGASMGEATEFLEQAAAEVFPQGFTYDYKGESRQFKQQGGALVVTFFLSLLVIYLVLAAQFESWRDPFIILVSVPLSVAGAMAFIMLGVASMNIYSQVGLITLIGVVSKNGILIVEFANQRRADGLDLREAIVEGAVARFRPVLMTSTSTTLGILPIALGLGAGSASRVPMGIAVIGGMVVASALTLFVIPAVFTFLAREEMPEAQRRAADPRAGLDE
jgi:multidrug efflux pump